MRKIVLALFASCALASFGVKAQDTAIAIHNHPQKSVYNSSAEWIAPDYQCHIKDMDMLMHVHRSVSAPYYGVITKTTNLKRIPFQDKMFHWDGKILPGGP